MAKAGRDVAAIQGLTSRQAAFVLAYCETLNPKQASIDAGYSERSAHTTGSRLLTNVAVQRAIREKQAEKVADSRISVEWVLHRLAEEATYFPDADGKYGQRADANHNARVQALNLLGKHLGILDERVNVNVSGSIGVSHQLAGLDTEDLKLLIEAGRQARALREANVTEGEARMLGDGSEPSPPGANE